MKLKYVCPFCFESHDIGDVEFACEARKICGPVDANGNITQPGVGEEDPKLAKYKGVPSWNGPHVFRGKKSRFSMPSSAACDWCKRESHKRVCPSCHNELPSTIDSDEQIIVALIGTRGSGKSTYIGVLIHEMMKRIFRPFGGTFQLYGPEDQKQYRERFEEDLYIRNKLIAQTQSHLVGSNVTENRPILGMLRKESGGLFKKMQAMTLVFFDSAGEDWEDPDTINVVANYVAHSSGIIFLLDPLANRQVRSKIDNDEAIRTSGVVEEGEVSSPSAVLDMVASLIRNANHIKETEKIDIPVAAAFSKLDVLEDNNVLPPGSALSHPSPHVAAGAFDDNDRKAVDNEMRALLDTWDQGDFVDRLKQQYTKASCFAFSAMGRAPQTDGTITPPAPKRIEDAMLWILNEKGIL